MTKKYTKENFFLGQRIFIKHNGKEKIITKIGRKYLTLNDGKQVHINNLRISSHYEHYEFCLTFEESLEYTTKEKLRRKIGNRIEWSVVNKLNNDQLERILNILKEKKDGE